MHIKGIHVTNLKVSCIINPVCHFISHPMFLLKLQSMPTIRHIGRRDEYTKMLSILLLCIAISGEMSLFRTNLFHQK